MKSCFLAVLALSLLASHTTSAASAAATRISWPAPRDPLVLTRKAGLVPERHETLTFHVHSHLVVFVNGQNVLVPAGIGINIHDPGVQHNPPGQPPFYGGITQCRRPCISPLHTHDTSGILHTESSNAVPHRLGQFFIEWGVRFSANCVDTYCRPHVKIAVYVNGKRYLSDPTKIPLRDRTNILVVVGRPPTRIPTRT